MTAQAEDHEGADQGAGRVGGDQQAGRRRTGTGIVGVRYGRTAPADR